MRPVSLLLLAVCLMVRVGQTSAQEAAMHANEQQEDGLRVRVDVLPTFDAVGVETQQHQHNQPEDVFNVPPVSTFVLNDAEEEAPSSSSASHTQGRRSAGERHKPELEQWHQESTDRHARQQQQGNGGGGVHQVLPADASPDTDAGAGAGAVATHMSREDLKARIEKAERILSGTEESIADAAVFCRSHSRKLKVVGGGILTLYGDKFLYTTLVFQAVRSGALPNVRKALEELSTTYHASRAAMREEIRAGVSTVRPHHILYSLQKSLDPDAVKLLMTNVMMTGALAIATVTSTTAGAITMGLSMGHTISTKLLRVFDRVMAEIEDSADAAAAAEAEEEAAAEDGGEENDEEGDDEDADDGSQDSGHSHFHVRGRGHRLRHRRGRGQGRVLSERLQFARSDEGKRWIRGAVQVGTNSLTVLFAARFRRLTMVFATCALGSQMLLDSTLSMVDAALSKLGLESLTLRDWPLGTDVIQSILMWFGFWSQVRPGAHGLPIILSVPLLPFHILESLLRSLVRTRAL